MHSNYDMSKIKLIDLKTTRKKNGNNMIKMQLNADNQQQLVRIHTHAGFI